MKFRYVFIIFGGIIALCVGGVIARNAVAEARLLRTLPQYAYEWNMEAGMSALLVDGAAYYIVRSEESNLYPIEVEETPFGVKEGWTFRNRDYLHWVDATDKEWIFMNARLGLSGGLAFVYKREDAKIPVLEDVTVTSICLSDAHGLFPTQAQQQHITALLEGVQAQAFADTLLASEAIDYHLEPLQWAPEGFVDLYDNLQLCCAEHPRMAFMYRLYENPEGQIVVQNLYDMSGFYVTLTDHYTTLIKEALSQ